VDQKFFLSRGVRVEYPYSELPDREVEVEYEGEGAHDVRGALKTSTVGGERDEVIGVARVTDWV